MSSVNADFITPKYSNVVNIWPAYSKDFSAGTFTTDVLNTPSFSATSIAFTSATATYLNVGTLAGSHMNVSSLSASTLSVSTITVNNLSIGTLTCTALDSGIISIGTQGGSLLATASCGTLGEFLASSNGFEVTVFSHGSQNFNYSWFCRNLQWHEDYHTRGKFHQHAVSDKFWHADGIRNYRRDEGPILSRYYGLPDCG